MGDIFRIIVIVDNVGRSYRAGPPEMSEEIRGAPSDVKSESVFLIRHLVLRVIEKINNGRLCTRYWLCPLLQVRRPASGV